MCDSNLSIGQHCASLYGFPSYHHKKICRRFANAIGIKKRFNDKQCNKRTRHLPIHVTHTYLTYQQPLKFHPNFPFNTSPSSNFLTPICLSYMDSTLFNIAIFTGAGSPQHVAWKITVSSTRCGRTHLLPKLSGCRYATRNCFTGSAEDAPRGRRRFKTICSLYSGCLYTQIRYSNYMFILCIPNRSCV